MKTNRLLLKILPLVTIFLISCQNKQPEIMSKKNDQNLIVLVKYKIQPSKSEVAIAGLTKLIEEVKNEPNFVNIKLHIDLKDDSTILLYEAWSDANYYNDDHMKTIHLQSFMNDSRAFLAGPPEISQWKIEKEFSSK
jgi:quinol monooxygenase YgiN